MRNHRSGFTLMELLIVITVIMLLAGLLFPAINLVKNKSKRAAAESQLSNVKAALESYKMRNAVFPDAGKLLPSDPDDAYENAFLSGTTYKTADAVGSAAYESVNKVLAMQLASAGSELKTEQGVLLDPWGTPIRYRPGKYHPFTKTAALPIDQDPPPTGADAYALWSAGPDRLDQGGAVGSDDITAWVK